MNNRNIKRIFVEMSLFVVLVLVFMMFLKSNNNFISGEAPQISTRTIINEPILLSSYRDKPVLIYFWATWCPICKYEKSVITKISKEWNTITVPFEYADKSEVLNYTSGNGLKEWTVLLDKNKKIAETYNIQAVPTFYIIDSEGIIRFSIVGYTSYYGLYMRLLYTRLRYG